VQSGHKPRHAQGPSFTSLLEALGCLEPDKGINPFGCVKPIDRIMDARACNGSDVVGLVIRQHMKRPALGGPWNAQALSARASMMNCGTYFVTGAAGAAASTFLAA
jgi:hypothetical protein